eukprot:5670036-Prymnesium_polylepis.1
MALSARCPQVAREYRQRHRAGSAAGFRLGAVQLCETEHGPRHARHRQHDRSERGKVRLQGAAGTLCRHRGGAGDSSGSCRERACQHSHATDRH